MFAPFAIVHAGSTTAEAAEMKALISKTVERDPKTGWAGEQARKRRLGERTVHAKPYVQDNMRF